jgi:hypothetical protein
MAMDLGLGKVVIARIEVFHQSCIIMPGEDFVFQFYPSSKASAWVRPRTWPNFREWVRKTGDGNRLADRLYFMNASAAPESGASESRLADTRFVLALVQEKEC